MKTEKLIEGLGVVSAVVFLGLTLLNFATGLGAYKVTIIGWTALLAMVAGAILSRRELRSERGIIWVYGVSGGAALASIFFFVLPKAIALDQTFGVTGILAGFLSGLVIHSFSHRLVHHHEGFNTFWSISLHSVTAGLIIGLIYQQLPTIGILLGIAIVSHKLPAGYMLAERIGQDRIWRRLLLPATGVGSMALASFTLNPQFAVPVKALFFGFSSGIFIHLALDFIPNPEPESHLRKILTQEEDPLHHELDSLATHCVASTIAGVAIVTVLALTL